MAFLPGAQGGVSAPSVLSPNVLEVQLHSKSELRLVVPADEGGQGKLLVVPPPPAGSRVPPPLRVEVFGTPLLPGNRYDLPPGARLAVFSWTDATIRIEGSTALRDSVYKAANSLYATTAELHCLLHQYRDAAQRNQIARERLGPRVVVCGARATGKHALAQTLSNYAARFGWAPTVLDASLESQMFGLPGSICVASWDLPSTLDEGVGNVPYVSFLCGLPVAQRFAPSRDGDSFPVSPIYCASLDAAVQLVKNRLVAHVSDIAGPSGCIVVLPPLLHREGVDVVSHVIDEIDATHIACFGDDFLHSQLRERYASPELSDQGKPLFVRKGSNLPLCVERMSPSTGACRLSDRQTKELQDRRCMEYFQGNVFRTLRPTLLSIGRECQLPEDVLERIFVFRGNKSVERITARDLEGIQQRIGAIYDLPRGTGEGTLLGSTIDSFVHIKEVDLRGTVPRISFLAVCPKEGLPKRPALVVGEITCLL